MSLGDEVSMYVWVLARMWMLAFIALGITHLQERREARRQQGGHPMPRATIDPQETERFELTSLPEGYVVLRKMSYDAFLQRRDMITQIKLARQRGGKSDTYGEMNMMNRKVAIHDFQECVVEHNLEDHDGELLDFSKPHTFKKLDPRVGQEIGQHIDELNQFATEDELGN